MRGAAREMGERDGGELRRAQRLRHGELGSVGGDPCCRRAPPRRGRRTSSAAGMTTSHAQRTDASSWRCASRNAVISQRDSGATSSEPSPMPAETSATARLRFAVNQRVVVAISGA